MSFENCEALIVWFTVKDDSFQFLRVQGDCTNVTKLLYPTWCAQEDIDNGAFDTDCQVILLLFQRDVSGE